MKRIEIKKGDRFSRIKILSETTSSITPGGTIRRRYLCQCDCGKIWSVAMSDLKNGDTKSCGCLKTDRNIVRLTKHRMCRTTTYKTWCNMKNRCLSKKNKEYKNYGGRGITVCKKWLKFEDFYNDMGEKPSKKYSIERINNDGNYCKENCCWIHNKEQNKNKSVTKFIEYKGERLCQTDWSQRLGGSKDIVFARINTLGWDPIIAITTPVKKYVRNK